MPYRLLADAVVVVHLAFIVFVAAGALAAWRWPRALLLHVPSVAWALASVTVGLTCPLTVLETSLRHRAGLEGYGGGFVDRYVEGVVYPDRLTSLLQALVAAAVVVGYTGIYRRQRRPAGSPSAVS